MTDSTLRVGVVGAGFIAMRRHLPFWSRKKDVELVAISDLNDELLNQACERFRVPQRFSSMDEMIATTNPDVIDICTPPGTHLQLATAALNAGCHVVMEKPMALTSHDCYTLAEAAARADRQLCVIHQMLAYPPVIKARDLVREGRIGKVHGVRIFIANAEDEYLAKDGWVHKLPGGLIGETGPHVISLAQAFIGSIRKVHAFPRKMSEYPWAVADDYILDLDGEEATASIRVVHNSTFWAGELEVWGSAGRIKVDLQAMTLHLYERKSLNHREIGRSVTRELAGVVGSTIATTASVLVGRFRSGHVRVLDAFVDAVQGQGVLPITPRQASEVVEVLEEVARQVGDTVQAGATAASQPVKSSSEQSAHL